MARAVPAGVLTNSTPSFLNCDIGALRKRKRADEDHGDFPHSFTIRPHSSSASDTPVSLKPLFLISRQCLPLSYLDTTVSPQPITGSRLFSAGDDLLGFETDDIHPVSLLIAQSLSDEKLYAVERVESRIYSLCTLGDWVTLDVLCRLKRQLPTITSKSPSKSGKGTATTTKGHVWWTSARLGTDDLTEGLELYGSKHWTTRLFNAKPCHGSEQSHALVDREETCPPLTEDPPLPRFVNGEVGGPCGESLSEHTHQGVLDKVRSQYLETLYISKTSVAYFAKGPLARARAAGSRDSASPLEITDLLEHLRNAILPLKRLDSKYKESLPRLVQEVIGSHCPLGDNLAESRPAKKRKLSKKKGLGKTGLYPDEDEYVRRWWTSRAFAELGDSAKEARDGEVKRLLTDLRFRETQLQILLVLEILALESTHHPEVSQPEEPTPADGVTAGLKPSNATKPKQKKVENLNSLLDMLVDRLCIWQTLSIDQPVEALVKKASGSNKKENDILRDFCVEVIMPFYASRLPDQCKGISRKLGVVNAISPKRPALAKAASTSQLMPGTTLKREQPDKTRKPLQRVLTDHGISQPTVASLLRSNTAPMNRQFKREESEPLQTARPTSRGGIQKPKRIDNREVDLNAIARQKETKLKKMNSLKEQKKELDEAINALRKPNRGLVSRDFVDSALERTHSSSRKPKNPLRNPSGVGVQVMATPKAVRKRDAIGVQRPETTRNHSPQPDPPSSEMYIPSSAIRPVSNIATAAGVDRNESVARGRGLFAVQETPSRGPSKLSDPLGVTRMKYTDSTNDLELPLPPLPRLSNVAESPFKLPRHPLETPRKRLSVPAKQMLTPTQQTRMKMSATTRHGSNEGNVGTSSNLIENRPIVEEQREAEVRRALPDSSPPIASVISGSSPPLPPVRASNKQDSPRRGANKSIYETLGWDTYDDDLDELAL